MKCQQRRRAKETITASLEAAQTLWPGVDGSPTHEQWRKVLIAITSDSKPLDQLEYQLRPPSN